MKIGLLASLEKESQEWMTSTTLMYAKEEVNMRNTCDVC